MILIVTTPGDPPIRRAAESLRRRGADFDFFNPAQFPAAATLSVSYGTGGVAEAVLAMEDRRIRLDRLTTVWNRRPGRPKAHDAITDPATREMVAVESHEFVQGLWQALRCRFVPAPPTRYEHEHKTAQLALAAELGFELPPTLITNDPQAFIEFYRAHDGQCITKMLHSKSIQMGFGSRYGRFTDVVSTRDIGHAEQVQYCPVLLQAYVPKRVELRITVVGQRLFAAEIHSQKTRHTRHDWRRYEHRLTPYFVHSLPSNIAARCLSLTERMGLSFGAIDLILTPDGRYVFIEINPGGEYDWIEQKTNMPITEAICDLLQGVT